VEPVRELILKRSRMLAQLGLGYLTLERGSTTLSGGEAQRIRLANQAATGLRHVLYVLDEAQRGAASLRSSAAAGTDAEPCAKRQHGYRGRA